MSESPLAGKRVVMAGAIVIFDVTLESELRRVGARTEESCELVERCAAVCDRIRPDLVLVGVTVRNLSESIDAIEKIVQDPEACVAAITINLDIEDDRRLREAGATAIFRKPFKPADLIPALEETFRQHGSRGD